MKRTRLAPALLFALPIFLPIASIARADAGAEGFRVGDDEAMPPWVDVGDVPAPSWARSVAPNRADAAIYAEPGRIDARRGSAQLGARLPLFGTKRAGACAGRWLEVGPLAWMCSDVADYAGEEPGAPPLGTLPMPAFFGPDRRALPPAAPITTTDDGLPFRYFFAGRDGAYGFVSLTNALDDSPDQELEQGFAIASIAERSAHGEKWIESRKARWFAERELVPSRTFLFHGERVEGGKLDVAWVVADQARVFTSPKADKQAGIRTRFEELHVTGDAGDMVKVSEDGRAETWIKARDVARPRVALPPDGIDRVHGERWIDVDLGQQALVAYEGDVPVFATVVSSGRGPKGSDAATPVGTHRIWVKIFATKMDNLDKEDVEHHYAIEDVPWVMFFDKAVALHGAFWHHDFGHVHSHGCVNLAPLDARWLFAFTAPHLPRGWTAAYPTPLEPGTLVRVR